MSDIAFKLDPRIVIGADTVNRLGRICSEYGGRALVVSEPVLYENRVIDRVVSVLKDTGVEALVFDEVPAQATADVAENAAEIARAARCSAIVALGGLKTQAIARMAAMLVPGNNDLFSLLDGAEPDSSFLPYLAVPTTGRDPFLFSDRFVTVDPRDRSVKLVKSPPNLCVAAVIDPGLSESLSEKFASTTVFDGFCVAIEAYCSTKANFVSDSLLESAMELYSRIMASFTDERVFDVVGGSTNAGFLTAFGASLSAPGIGTALSYAINGRFPVAKSWSSTVLLPYVMERLLPARPEKLAKVAALLGEPIEGASVSSAAEMAVEGIRRRMGLLKVPARLKDFGLVLDKLVPVAEAARNLDFVAYSPRPISTEDAYDILKQSY
ncbi:MAG: alcohol dehydrogenase [Treponema sp. RIFOXYC1_FULL_61_9]|nr:MAG: alcohol dehydrogenase [Treponema sp. RIFOXYC1_FULL_61_9]